MVKQSGFDEKAAFDIVLALFEHRRVMDACRELCLDDATSAFTNPSRPVENDEPAKFNDLDAVRAHLRASKDPDDRLGLKLLNMVARIASRSEKDKINKLKWLGRYQRCAAAELSKAIRNN